MGCATATTLLWTASGPTFTFRAFLALKWRGLWNRWVPKLTPSNPAIGLGSDGMVDIAAPAKLAARAQALAPIPEEISFAEAAPLLCAGITTFNSLRNSGARGGDLVAVQGLGGLGHLGVQFARAMGYHVVPISRGEGKRAFAKKLGAHEYIESQKQDVAQELLKLGGARVVLATAISGDAITAAIGGLARNGCLMLLAAAPDPIPIRAGMLIGKRCRIQGWPSGQASDSVDTLRFAALTGIRPMIEKFPLAEANNSLSAHDAR